MVSMQSKRTGQAVVLTAVTMAFLTVVGFTFGMEAVVLSGVTLPVPLLLLWISTDVRRADETHPSEARVRPAHNPEALAGRARLLNH